MDTERFNGWKNHSTWAMNLNLMNTEGPYELVMIAVNNCAKRCSDSEEYFQETLAEELKIVGEVCAEAGVLVDFTPEGWHFINDVDWDEIAGHFTLEEFSGN